jgi:2'-5' RNA ligase
MGSYTNADGSRVEFTDSDTIRDVADLWAVVRGEYNGTPSMENAQLEAMLSDLEAGRPLSDAEFGVLHQLRGRYAAALEAFRASPENEAEGYVPAPDVGSARVMESLRVMPPSALRRLREAEAPSSAGGNSGAMIALFPEADVAERLAVPGGLPAGELHLTLAFLGSASMIADAERLRNVVGRWASATAPLTGEVSGVGQFTALAQPVTYASVDLPRLPAAREDLVERLSSAGIAPSSTHGFSPHMTLSNDLRKVDAENVPLTFDHATLCLGDERWNFPLSGLGDRSMRLSEVLRLADACERMREDAPVPLAVGDHVRDSLPDLSLGRDGVVVGGHVEADGAITHDVAYDDGAVQRRVREYELRYIADGGRDL